LGKSHRDTSGGNPKGKGGEKRVKEKGDLLPKMSIAAPVMGGKKRDPQKRDVLVKTGAVGNEKTEGGEGKGGPNGQVAVSFPPQ